MVNASAQLRLGGRMDRREFVIRVWPSPMLSARCT